jgi:hypothetical protein
METLGRFGSLLLIGICSVLPVSRCALGQSTGTNSSQQGPPSPPQAQSGAAPHPQDALDNPLLENANATRTITFIEPFVNLEYRHDALDGGVNTNTVYLRWLQSFGPKGRFAAGIELPFGNATAPEGEPSGGGIGDIRLGFRGMLHKGEHFEHAAGIEITLPSASNDTLGEGQTVLKFIWGFSAELAKHTLLSGEFGYNKAVQNQHATPGVNSIEPELILTQGLAKRVACYLDWDNYYEFNIDEYVQTLEAGAEFAIDRKNKWTFAPYIVFPLNHAGRITETKNAVGFNLNYNW